MFSVSRMRNLLIFFTLIYSVSLISIIDQDITTNTLFTLSNSPYHVTKSITVVKTVQLMIEPGVILKMYPKVKISIEGILIANGDINNRITFTKFNDTRSDSVLSNLRLVDGLEYREGKLQIKYQTKWRPICSQNREWSANDIQVVCREMGFMTGNFSLNGKAENDTTHMLLLDPGCLGNETSLAMCPGFKNAVIGSAVCNLQELVGFHCWGANVNNFRDNWSGLTFYNSTKMEIVFVTHNTRLNVSRSQLNYVDILYAGVNWTNHRVAAVSSSPYPPRMSNARLLFNAYDGLNFTDIRGPVIINDSLFESNHGYGINITSAVGYVHLTNVTARKNAGAGAYIRITSNHWAEETPELVDLSKSICGQGVITSSPMFPFLLVTEHLVPTYKSDDSCFLPVTTDRLNQIISIKLLEAIRDPTAEAVIIVTDELMQRTLAVWNFTSANKQSRFSETNKLFYGPLYQGVSSISGRVKITYNWKKNPSQQVCPYLRQCFRGIIQVSVGETTNPEVVISNSLFDMNIQHGLRIENLGLYAQILNSTFSNNEYGAGLSIVNGSSDVLVNSCLFQNNDRTGLNITMAAGTRIVNNSKFIDNRGHGLDIWNPTWLMTRYGNGPIENTVFLSVFQNNLWNGIRFYNSSTPMNILVNYSSFIDNRKNGIEMVASIMNQNELLTNFSVGFSKFHNNLWHGILISPIGQMTGMIINSTFSNHNNGGAIYIDNGINFEEQRLVYKHLPVSYNISYNDFHDNTGPFVISVRLTRSSHKQNCLVIFNRFFKNRILNSKTVLNSRSYARAVVVIGSSNVVFTRNFIQNPESSLEIATQMVASDEFIDATKNFWGSREEFQYMTWEQIHGFVFRRLFDHESRYSLAKINYFPLLKEPVLQSDIFSDTDPQYRQKFRNNTSLEIGGAIDVKIEQRVDLPYSPYPYRVTRDIFVPLGATLTVAPGSQFEFENSIGLFVQGSINMKGSNINKIKMFMKNTGKINSFGLSIQVITKSQMVVSGNNLTQINSTLVGPDIEEVQGILRVKIGGEWGVICDNNFDLISARIACTEIGMVAHPMDWQVIQSMKLGNVFNDTIIMSTVRCQSWMTSFEQCEYDSISEHNCTRDIVNIRCHRPGWAGMTVSLTNEISTLTGVVIEEAGLLDYYISQFKPALQIDFNKHILSNILISKSLSDGLMIYFNDLLSFNNITNLITTNNLGSGLITKTPWVTFEKCTFSNNKLSGLKFDPGFSEEELFDFRASMLRTLNMIPHSSYNKVIYLSIHPTGIEVLYTPVGYTPQQVTYWIELKASDPNNQQQLLLNLIDFNPDISVENVTLYDNSYETVMNKMVNRDQIFTSSITWSIPNDLTRFPIVSNKQYITIKLVLNGTLSGRLSFIVQATSFNELWNRNIIPRNSTTASGTMYYFPTSLKISNCDMLHNSVGSTIIHYNTGTDSQNRTYTQRQSRIYIDFIDSKFHNNSLLGLHVPSVSPFARDFYFPTYGDNLDIESSARISRIFYRISGCQFTNNKNILLVEHNHVPFSNNVWRYMIINNEFRDNFGGLDFQLPFVSTRFDWHYIPDIDHVIEFVSNRIISNTNYQLVFEGYFLRLDVKLNLFSNNNCGVRGMLSLHGMEKRFNISQNSISNIIDCPSIIEVTSDSQTEQASPVLGIISYNDIVNSACSQSSYAISNVISCYTVGIFGNQNVTVNRNIFDNKYRFKYELVAGLVTNKLDSRFDATENYWGGVVDSQKIRTMIFDVNNWNNFAQVDFSRFLLIKDRFTSQIFLGIIEPVAVDISGRLGGQISRDLFLQSRSQAYIVESDLTVLPGIVFRIDSGVTLEFAPNVGILVFGKLIARGVLHRPIVMRPIQKIPSSRNRRSLISEPNNRTNSIRLIGGKFPDEGFVQIYNESFHRWDYLCDNQFSKQVGSVVCRQLGLKALNPRISRSYLVDYQLYGYDNPFVIKYVWNTRYTCRGFEPHVENCVKRFNYNAFQCLINRQFLFLKCERDFLNQGESFWGNIRIVLPGLEQSGKVDESGRSYLEFVNISKAGVLHGELVSAIQTTHAYPHIRNVNIEKCAWNSIDIIAPRLFVQVSNSSFTDNIGYGIGITLLNGDSSDPLSNAKQLIPMRLSPMPSSVLGLIDMCDITKEIFLDDRIIIYYRYSYKTIACTKLIRSRVPNKQIAVRFLQLNLFYDPFTKNSIEMFNGEAFNTTELLFILNARPILDDEENGFLSSYESTPFVTKFGYDMLGLHLHASPASEYYGFIMEIITVPMSPDTTFSDVNQYTVHRVSESSFTRNQAGAVRISAVGEMNPVIDVYYNRFMDNGGSAMLNITADPVTLIRLQNCREVNVGNNYYYKNRGGAELHLYSSGLNRAIRANFTNNVLINTTMSSVLKIIGNYISTVRVERNFFANNDCEQRDVIKIHGVLMNPFAYNYLNKNRGTVMVNISGEENISTRSQYLWNGFYENLAINYTRSATIFCANSKNIFKNNYFRNLRNDFEMVVGNRSIMKESPIEPGDHCPLARECPSGWTEMLERNSCVCYRPDNIVATENWWGESPTYFTRGRIWEHTDDKYLIPVDYTSSFKTNESVLGGGIYCPPTWKFYDRNCYFYFGAPLDYNEAKSFCQTEIDAVLADSRNIISWLGGFMASSQNNYYWLNRDSWNTRIWVHSYVPFSGRCPAIRSNWIEGFQCEEKIQFVCQKSPYGAYKPIQIEILVALIIVSIIFGLILLLCLFLWYRNSKRRHKAFLIRCTELKHQQQQLNQPYLIHPGVIDDPQKPDYLMAAGSRHTSTSNLYSSNSPATATDRTMKSIVSSTARSKYDEDIMKMRRNTLTDIKEAISRPKSSIDYGEVAKKPLRNIEVPIPMMHPKKSRYDPRSKPKTSTLASQFSGASLEALYVKAPPGSQLKLSQPDVPKLFRSTDSRSNLQLASNNYDEDPSKMQTMVDPLLDPSIMARNRPTVVRSPADRTSFSISDSISSSSASRTRDTSALLPSDRQERAKPSKLSSRPGRKHQRIPSESEI